MEWTLKLSKINCSRTSGGANRDQPCALEEVEILSNPDVSDSLVQYEAKPSKKRNAQSISSQARVPYQTDGRAGPGRLREEAWAFGGGLGNLVPSPAARSPMVGH